MSDYFHQVNLIQDPYFPCINISDSYREGVGFSMHWHEEFEIIQVLEGCARVVVGIEHMDVFPGYSAIINTNMLHSIVALKAPYRHECIMIDKAFCLQNQIDLDKYMFQYLIHDEKVNQIIHSIVQEIAQKEPCYKAQVRSELMRLLVHLCRMYNTMPKSQILRDDIVHRKLSYVKSTLTFIRRKHKEHITLNQICDYVGLDKFYLCHLFKQITGETIVEYINFIRCEYAKKYLASGDFTVIECAEQSGFPDSSYFSRVYKRYMGVLPSEELPNKKEIL